MTGIIRSDFIMDNFPSLAKMVYLNNASTGIPPTATIEAMKKYLEERIRAKNSFEDTLRTMDRIRDLLAQLLGGEKHNYGLVPNTSEGLNIAAHGIEYPQGSNIVICDLEFPANYIPWQNAAKWYDVELRVVRSKNGAATVEDFQALIDENTRVVAVSMVQFGTGYRIDLKRLADVVHDVGGFLVTDIIQSAGWADMNLSELNVDFAAAQSAKWLIGPIGAGFVYVSDDALERILPRFTGWWGVEDIMEFGYNNRTLIPDARKYQTGSLPLVSYVGFLSSLEVLLQIPSDKRERAAMRVAEYLRERLTEIGVDHYDYGQTHNSPIVSCAPENVEKIHEKLMREEIYCSVRNGRLRISPHFYNTKEEIDKLITVLE